MTTLSPRTPRDPVPDTSDSALIADLERERNTLLEHVVQLAAEHDGHLRNWGEVQHDIIGPASRRFREVWAFTAPLLAALGLGTPDPFPYAERMLKRERDNFTYYQDPKKRPARLRSFSVRIPYQRIRFEPPAPPRETLLETIAKQRTRFMYQELRRLRRLGWKRRQVLRLWKWQRTQNARFRESFEISDTGHTRFSAI